MITNEYLSRLAPTSVMEKPASSRDEEMLQVKEVAQMLGIHPNTVRIWADSGVLLCFRVGPRRDRRIPKSAIQRLLAA